MEEIILKYGFTYGPLMLFFLFAGVAIWKWGPPIANAASNLFKEMVIALNASTTALENSTRALSANNEATTNLMQTHESLRGMWEEMRERIDSFSCPHAPTPRHNKIVTLAPPSKKAQNQAS